MFSSHSAIVGIDHDNANVGIRGGQWPPLLLLHRGDIISLQSLCLSIVSYFEIRANFFRLALKIVKKEDENRLQAPSPDICQKLLRYDPAPPWSDVS